MAIIHISEPEKDFEEWKNRYSGDENLLGHFEWMQQTVDGDENWVPPNLFTDDLKSINRHLKRPRVFISHRQGDELAAKRIAYLADQEGFDYWLDVINMPPPSQIAKWSSHAIALRIEMALLNCTHLIGVYTDKTNGSTWVPYEYGRVREKRVFASECCTWLCTNKPYPEWLELNPKFSHESDIKRWLRIQIGLWKKKNGNIRLMKPAGNWNQNTIPLIQICSQQLPT